MIIFSSLIWSNICYSGMSLNDKIISKLLKYERILNVFIVQLCFISYFFVGGKKKENQYKKSEQKWNDQ